MASFDVGNSLRTVTGAAASIGSAAYGAMGT